MTGFSISVNVNEGIRVAPPFTAEDPNGDELTYSIVLDTPDSFTIDPATGEVRMGSLDIEEDDVFTATVQVTDGFGEDGYPDPAIDDSLDITMTIVDPNIVVATPDRTFQPFGLWANDDVIITTNRGSTDWVRFYDADDGSPIADRHFKLKYVYGPRPKDVWSDGDTLYVLDQSGQARNQEDLRLRAGRRQPPQEQGNHAAPGQPSPRRPLGPGRRHLRVRRNRQHALPIRPGHPAAHQLRPGHPRRRKQNAASARSDTSGPTAKPSGPTRWLSHWVRAYDLETGARIPRLDIQMARANYGSTGIHSDGFNFWSIERVQNTIYGYVLPQ